MKSILTSLIALLLLFGCSINSPKSISQRNHILFELTSIPEHLQNRVWFEKFSINIKLPNNQKINQKLLLQTELTNTQINLVALSLEGLPLLQASWNSQAQSLNVEKLVDNDITNKIDVKKIVHDLQATHWPINKIEEVLYTQYSVKDSILNDVKIRRFSYQNKVIIEIRKTADQTDLDYFSSGHKISIVRIKDNPLKVRPKKK